MVGLDEYAVLFPGHKARSNQRCFKDNDSAWIIKRLEIKLASGCVDI